MKNRFFTCGLIAAALATAAHGALTLHLTFDDATNATTMLKNDGSGTVVWGASAGMSSTAGLFGNAVSLTTTSSLYSQQAGTNLSTNLNSFTVAMHIKQGANAMVDWGSFASFGDDNNSVFRLQLNEVGKTVSVHTTGSPGGGAVSFGSSGAGNPSVNDGAWHHVALVSNGSIIELFVDGVSHGSQAYTGGATTALDALQLGAAYGGKNGDALRQNVQIDDLGIWNEALTPAQIAYYSTNVIPEPSAALLGGLGLLALLRRRRA